MSQAIWAVAFLLFFCSLYAVHKYRERRRVWRPRRAQTPSSLPRLLLVTDIGDDIDDLLALLLTVGLHHLKVLQLVAVVTCGGHELLRAATVRFWLRKLGIRDFDVLVAASKHVSAPGKAMPATPDGCQSPENSSLYPESGAQLILDMARRYTAELKVVCLGELSPVEDALELDTESALTRIGGLCIQGQARMDYGRLVPDEEAYNIRCNVKAARRVFAQLQDRVPLQLLGKYAAYRVHLTAAYFKHWTNAAERHVDMVAEARENLNKFRCGNPSLFYKLYSVPDWAQNESDWFSTLKVYSHPYDPSLVLSMMTFDKDLFQPLYHGCHTLIGCSKEQHGVRNSQHVASALSQLITISCKRIAAVANGQDFTNISIESGY